MSNIKFEWDARKASANEKKHGISFAEARTVFFDENAKLIDDPAITVLVAEMFPRVALITPNLDEAAILVGRPLSNPQDMALAA